MSDEKYCPFWFGLSYHSGYCIKKKCALWVDEDESSACSLAYEALYMAKNRKGLANIRGLTPWATIKVFGRDGDCDA